MESMEVDCDESYLELDPEVYQLIYDNAPVDDILDAWARAYGEVKLHPRVANCTSECVNVLACFAVHFEDDALLERVMPLCSPFCKFSPHITAMFDGNLAMEEAIHKAMPKVTCGCHSREYDVRTVHGHVWPSTKGYGCIKDNSINVGEEISVVDILFKWDDWEALDFVFQFNIGFFHPLLDMAKCFNSRKCFKYIQDKMTDIATVEPPYNNYTNLLQMLLGCVSRRDGTITQLHVERAISLWAALRCTHRTQRFLSATEEAMLTSLLDGHRIQQSMLQQMCASLSDDALQELHHNVILESCATLISKMTGSLGDSAHGVVPMQILTNIIQIVHCILAWFPLAVGKTLISSSRSLKLFNAISKMVMQAGIQAPVCRHCSTGNCIHDGWCSCYNGFEQHSVENFFRTMMMVEIKLGDFPDDMDKEIFQLAHEHLMILLAYGHEGVYLDPYATPEKITLDGERTLVKLMPQISFNSCRQDYYNLVTEYLLPLEQKNNRTEVQERKLKSLRQQCDTKLLCGFDHGRSLKELCRIKLYEIVPKGKMPQYVEHLQLSREQKDYLSLGVRPL